MVKNIILDVGGILFDDSKENIEKLLGKDCDYIYKITYDKTFKKCLLGETSVQDYINDFKDNKEIGNIKIYLKETKKSKKKLFEFLNR